MMNVLPWLMILPAGIVLGFFLHWLTIRSIDTAEGRLPYCRGAYLAFSAQLLLFAWAVFFTASPGRYGAVLIPLGMTFSFAGDYFNLQFPAIRNRVREPVFLGILSFAAAQACYIGAFLAFIPLRELMQRGSLVPILAVLLIAPAAIFRLRVYHPERPRSLMMGGFLYGFALGTMTAITLSAALARGGPWIPVAAGALLFLLSDAVMGETTLHGRHPKHEYQVPWVTYLAAQGLILAGSAMFLLA
jgi:hypothetical protein